MQLQLLPIFAALSVTCNPSRGWDGCSIRKSSRNRCSRNTRFKSETWATHSIVVSAIEAAASDYACVSISEKLPTWNQ
jgi:hypothetical protein